MRIRQDMHVTARTMSMAAADSSEAGETGAWDTEPVDTCKQMRGPWIVIPIGYSGRNPTTTQARKAI